MDTVDDNGVERNKYTHMTPWVKIEKSQYCNAHAQHDSVSYMRG